MPRVLVGLDPDVVADDLAVGGARVVEVDLLPDWPREDDLPRDRVLDRRGGSVLLELTSVDVDVVSHEDFGVLFGSEGRGDLRHVRSPNS